MNLSLENTVNGSIPPFVNELVPSQAEQRLHVLELTVELLIVRTKIHDFWFAGFHDVVKLLETLPLTTSDFRVAKRHLSNAVAYCRQNEFGAAAFELRAVRGILQNL